MPIRPGTPAAPAPAPTFKYAASAPPATAGVTYELGDLCRNTSPIPGGSIGWVCTAAGVGAAATWKTWGPVAT